MAQPVDKSIYQELYEFETEQRSHLASTVNVPIVASTAIGSAAVTMALGYPYASSVHSNCFNVFLGLTALSLGTAIYFVFRSLIGFEYERLPSALKLRAFHAELLQANRKLLGANKEAEALTNTQKAFIDGLEQRYSEAADINRANNHNRGRFTYSANVALAVGTIMLGSASTIYLHARITMPTEVHHVRIVGDVKMTAMPTEQQPAHVPTIPVQPDTPAPAVIPTFPPNEKFRDHTPDIPATTKD